MSAQASGKAGHEWTVSEHLRGACFMSKMSAHFPRITKHDLEVVVEAMDKLREALQRSRFWRFAA